MRGTVICGCIPAEEHPDDCVGWGVAGVSNDMSFAGETMTACKRSSALQGKPITCTVDRDGLHPSYDSPVLRNHLSTANRSWKAA